MRGVMGTDCKTPHEFLLSVGVGQVPDERLSQTLQGKLSPQHARSEAQILLLEHKTPEGVAARAVLLLAVIYGKWRGIANDAALKYVADRAGNELWAGRLLPYLDAWLSAETTWSDTLYKLIEPFILDQHDRIMYEKRRLDSCWLRRTEGRILKDQDYAAVWRASRFYNSVKIMNDLGLVRIDAGKDLTVTPQGQKLLNNILRQA